MRQLHIHAKRPFCIGQKMMVGAVLLISSAAAISQDFTDPAAFDWSGLYAGVTVGAGVEVAVTDKVPVGVEYLYMDFGRPTMNGIGVVCFDGGSPGTPHLFDFDTTVQTVRFNVSWKFVG